MSTSNYCSLQHLLSGLDIDAAEYKDLHLSGLQQDSRKVKQGDCFIAVTGLETDGRRFIDKAIKAGAAAVLQEADGEDHGAISSRQGVPVVSIKALLHKMSRIAANFYAEPSTALSVVGFTGTNGKTSCTQLFAQLQALLGQRAAMLGTMGYGEVDRKAKMTLQDTGMTTPDAIRAQAILAELREAGMQSVAMEVSSHSLMQGRVAAVDFDIAVFTNLSRDHLDYHGSMAAYAKAKAKLFTFKGLSAAVLNLDDEYGEIFAHVLKASGLKTLTYSCTNQFADIYCESAEYHSEGMTLRLVSPWGRAELQTQLLGGFNVSNLLAVMAAAIAKGYSWESLCELLPELCAVKGRLETFSHAGITVVVDYAHTPDALEKALLGVRQHCSGRLQCVFGCGGDRDRGKRPQMGAIAARLADRIWVTSDNPRNEDPQRILDDIQAGIDASAIESQMVVDRKSAIEQAIAGAVDGDCILIAGKGHEDYQIVKGEKLWFDDRVIAEKFLQEKQIQQGGVQ
ncbi:UDP-N-acetylmuramoyl-L-alanyl-D-glutamate--2,6-diaminopimelate ligase [uncultured Pseudoteredinibacter sp.]|uniref:UDP-N-acetylmuramoyl-L-alanyl-D-glutamate--2, 6-diaminopimelate ligase n=1 Tax=uncultured Pseudoteredinibacter sp. TaxID=1641701 RepID=UPI002631110D|nr:UDP-N-acetylmuramoyl-L-alanyl-D-glutamate--2,6-diaminopimelate ligase [uncultured Pseudoteredinibacter sp.]